MIKLPEDIARECGHQEEEQPFPEISSPGRNALQFAAKDVARDRKSPHPGERPDRVVQEKLAPSHFDDSRQGGGHCVQAWNEFGAWQAARAVACKADLRPPDTGVGFERNPAKQLENPDALLPSELVPHR